MSSSAALNPKDDALLKAYLGQIKPDAVSSTWTPISYCSTTERGSRLFHLSHSILTVAGVSRKIGTLLLGQRT